MAVHIRMSRIGRRNRPFYRIGAYDSHAPRNGKCLERLGWYDPLKTKEEDQFKLDLQRTEYWLSVGAQPTEKAYLLLKKGGIQFPSKEKKREMAKKPS